MIILISSSSMDPTTDLVIDWIYSLKTNVKIIRVNDDEDYKITFEIDDIYINTADEKIAFKNIDSYWFRRGRIRYKFENNLMLKDLRNEEEKVLEEYIHYKLSNKRCLTNYFLSDVNKLIVLNEAEKCNLLIPKSFLIESKDELINLLKISPLITKNYLASSGFILENGLGLIYTTDVNVDEIDVEKFSPSFFQFKIDKKVELRIFYLNGMFWSMAIFSQSDDQTKTDFRIYNHINPNKTVPFNLPLRIKNKLNKLMINLKLDTGSIDMILTNNNQYVFLEVNPIGQFGMVSIPCQFYLEREIAKYLTYEN